MINPKLEINVIRVWKSEAMISLNLYCNAKTKIAGERRGICVPIMTPQRLRVVERTVVLTHPRWASSIMESSSYVHTYNAMPI